MFGQIKFRHSPFHNRLLIAFILFRLVRCDLAQELCVKIDFDRPSYSEFRECKEQRLPALCIENYTSHHEVPPYQPTSKYFLSNNFYGFSCIESNIILTFDQNTFIEAALYLRSIGNAFVEINIYDANINALMKSIRSDGIARDSWLILRGTIDGNISNARVSSLITSYPLFLLHFFHSFRSK